MFTADRVQGGSRWPVVRMNAGSQTQVILLADHPFALTVHWVGWSAPCAGDGCSLCETLAGRGLFYFPVICQQRASILELSSQSWSHLEQHAKLLHQAVRVGQVYNLTRRGAKNPIWAECVDFRENTTSVPDLALIQRVMAIYKFPPPQPADSLQTYEERIQKSALLRNERLALQIANRTAK